MTYRLFKISIIHFLIILFSSCQVIRYQSLKLTSDFGKTKTKTIQLKDKISGTQIKYHTPNAILIFSLTDSKRLLEKELNKTHQFKIRDKEGTKALLSYLRTIDSTLVLKDPFYGEIMNEEQMDLGGVYYNWLARDLLLDRNAIVIQKENNQRVKRIDFEIYYDKLGNYREIFILPNDSILIEGKILLGE